jgi:hypothetical protein
MQKRKYRIRWFHLCLCSAIGIFLAPISSANGQTQVSLRALQPLPQMPVMVSPPSPGSAAPSTDDSQAESVVPPVELGSGDLGSHDLGSNGVITAHISLRPLPGIGEDLSSPHPVIGVVSLQPLTAQEDKKEQGDVILDKLFGFDVLKLTENPTYPQILMKDLQSDRRYFESALVAEPTRLQGPEIGPYPWSAHGYCWESPSFCFSPLYFEQPNLERYGQGVGRPFTSASSAVAFVVDVTTLPIALICSPPCSKSCTLGHHRPGDCAPYQRKTLDH